MFDYRGVELSLGDSVIFTAPNYRHLTLGKIIEFTKCKVRVEFNNTWNFGQKGRIQQYLSEPDFLVKVPK